MPTGTTAIDQLVEMGLTAYQAKVYSSLVSLGVGSVSEIHRQSGVPRTKVYETLEELTRKGAVELQAGRPALYRAVHPRSMVSRLVEDYTDSANQVSKTLEKDYQEGRSVEYDLAWTVKGDGAIRRKLVEVIASAKEEVLVLETYPPFFIRTVERLLRVVAQRGVRVRAVCVLTQDQALNGVPAGESIEYRRLAAQPLQRGPAFDIDREVLGTLSVTLASPYGVAIVDRNTALVMIPNASNRSKSVGLSARIPGVPMLLRIMFEWFVVARTRILRPRV